MWTTAKHLAQGSCTELTLKIGFIKGDQINLRNDNKYLVVCTCVLKVQKKYWLLWTDIQYLSQIRVNYFTYRLFLMRAFEEKICLYKFLDNFHIRPGTFNNYVDRILPLFYHPPAPLNDRIPKPLPKARVFQPSA